MDRVEVHEAVDGLLSLGDPLQIIVAEGIDPSGTELGHHIGEGADASVPSGEDIVGEVIVKAGVNIESRGSWT